MSDICGVSDIDESIIKGDRICGDCRAEPGAYHMPGCDVERCGCRGGGQQTISCEDCTDESYRANRLRWTGVWPGKLEAAHHGLFCRDEINGKPATMAEMLGPPRPPGAVWHVPCQKDDEGAKPDLNRWHDMGCPPIPPQETQETPQKPTFWDKV